MKIRTALLISLLATSVPAFADKDEKDEAGEKETVVKLKDVPVAVTKAFAAKYPKAKATKAEKIEKGTEVSYELAWMDGKKKREATFKADGSFVEEE
ncbi:MAG TPA: hypothetical protein VGM90_41235 [Kofleriaceae bacterium]|jgi:hypothetical protein